MNDCTREDLVTRIRLGEDDWLWYHSFPVTVGLIRGSTADRFGNITVEHEGLIGEGLPIAQAAKNHGGLVIAQVAQVVDRITDPKAVRVPGILVDALVVTGAELWGHAESAGLVVVEEDWALVRPKPQYNQFTVVVEASWLPEVEDGAELRCYTLDQLGAIARDQENPDKPTLAEQPTPSKMDRIIRELADETSSSPGSDLWEEAKRVFNAAPERFWKGQYQNVPIPPDPPPHLPSTLSGEVPGRSDVGRALEQLEFERRNGPRWACPHCSRAIGRYATVMNPLVWECVACGRFVDPPPSLECPGCRRRFASVATAQYGSGRMCPNCGGERGRRLLDGPPAPPIDCRPMGGFLKDDYRGTNPM